MPFRTSNWAPGTPCWVDSAFDREHRGLEHARDFYSKMFGWKLEPGPPEAGGYTICLKDNAPAAAVTGKMSPDQVSAWVVFLASDDVDATANAVRAAGGQVVFEPQDVMTAGRTAFFIDPTGAFFGVWQGRDHPGFGIYNEIGSVVWNDLLTRDLEAAKAFYGKVFGYSYAEMGEGYVTFSLPDGTVVGGMHQADHLPTEAPPNWLTHFMVADRDASASMAEELGGSILMTMDTPVGPEAVIEGKWGEVFAIIAPSAEPVGTPGSADSPAAS